MEINPGSSAKINFTMPVFNRFSATQKALLGLYKTDKSIPYSITVVDNGSESSLVKKLFEFYHAGIIDKLFLLPRNMGIACASNIGWEMTPADVYCKIDNDTTPTRKDWTLRLFKMWENGDALSNLGYASSREQLLKNPGAIDTPYGMMGVCSVNLGGTGIFIPRKVSNIIGFWNEEYGLYGAEDGDYGVRMQCLNFKQYYYLGEQYIRYDLDDVDEAKYTEHGLCKSAEFAKVMERGGFYGLFRINNFLFNLCVRSPRVPRKFYIKDIDKNHYVVLGENKEFKCVEMALNECMRLLKKFCQKGKANLYDEDLLYKLKVVLKSCGQDMDSFVKNISC